MYKFFTSLFIMIFALTLAGCGGGEGGGSGLFGGESIQVKIQVANATIPANLNNEEPNLFRPTTTEVNVLVQDKATGRGMQGMVVNLNVNDVRHGYLTTLEESGGEFTTPMGQTTATTSGGGFAKFFFTSYSEAGTATLTASVTDPNGGATVNARTTIEIVGEVREVQNLTFTGPYIEALLTGATRFGSATLQNGTYSRVISVTATDHQGNPVNPNTPIFFSLIDAPIIDYPQSGWGRFAITGTNANPAENGFDLHAPGGNFLNRGARLNDRVVLDPHINAPNFFHQGIRTITSMLASQPDRLYIDPRGHTFRPGRDTGPDVPYIIGRAQHGTILSPTYTDVTGTASTLLTYPVSRLGQTAILVAHTADYSVSTVLNTGRAMYLPNLQDPGFLTTSHDFLHANSTTSMQLCLRDANNVPAPGATVRYSVGPKGPANIRVNGNENVQGNLTLGTSGCLDVVVAVSGQQPGSDSIPITFNVIDGFIGHAPPPLVVGINAPGAGQLFGTATCTSLEAPAQCEIDFLVLDDFGTPMSGALINHTYEGAGSATVTYNPPHGAFGMTNEEGRNQVTIAMDAPGEYDFVFRTFGGTTFDLSLGVSAPPEEPEPIVDTVNISMSAVTSAVPANLNNDPPNLSRPTTTEINVQVVDRATGQARQGIPVEITVNNVRHGGLSTLTGETLSTPTAQLSGQTAGGGIAKFFFTSTSEPGEAVITTTITDPETGRSLNAQTTITVTGESREVFNLTLTGPYVEALLTGRTRFGNAELQSGNYSRVISVTATDRQGNPVNPNTPIYFSIMDGPIDGYPQTGPGRFRISGNNANPVEGGHELNATGANLTGADRARVGDRLVLHPGINSDNFYHQGIRTITRLLSADRLNVDTPFRQGRDTGANVPYTVGRAQHGTILSPVYTDETGSASTLLTYPVTRIGQTAIIVAHTQDHSVSTILNTGGPVYLANMDGGAGTFTASRATVPANTTTSVELCLTDQNLAPVPSAGISYSVGERGPATVRVNGNTSAQGSLRLDGSGCATVNIQSSGQQPGAAGIPVTFRVTDGFLGEVPTPITLTILGSGAGHLFATASCASLVPPTTCTVNFVVQDDMGAIIQGAQITHTYNGPGAIVNYSPASGAFGVTDNQGRNTATINMQNEGDHSFVFTTLGGSSYDLNIGLALPEPTDPGDQGALNRAASLQITADKTVIRPDGVDFATITALVRDSGNRPVANVPVTLSIEGGHDLRVQAARTDENGTITAQLYYSASATPPATVTARVDGRDISAITPLNFTFAEPPEPGAPTPTSLQIQADKVSIRADGVDFATITALAKDAANRPVEGVPVEFSVDPTQYDLRVSGTVTGADGTLTARLYSGVALLAGQASVTARVTSAQNIASNALRFTFTGASLTVEPETVAMTLGESRTINITARNGAGNPAANQTLCLHVPPFVTLTTTTDAQAGCATSLMTDGSGRIRFDIRAENVESGTLRVTDPGNALTVQIPVTVTAQGIVFTTYRDIDNTQKRIDTLAGGERAIQHQVRELTVSVEDAQGNPYTGRVRFTTSSGYWNNTQGVNNVTVNVVNGIASASLMGFRSGVVTVSATKEDDSRERATFSFFAYDGDDLVFDQTYLSLQANPATMAISSGNQSTITSTVMRSETGSTTGDNLIPVRPGTLVSFEIVGPSLGTYLDNTLAYTDQSGRATTRLVVGDTPSSGEGVRVRSCVVGLSNNGTPKCDDVRITMTDRPGSISIGMANVISAINDDTAYELPVSIVATDINGGALANVEISLGIWPTHFSLGYRDIEGNAIILRDVNNEDLNRNVTRDLQDAWSSNRRLCAPAGRGEPTTPINDAADAFAAGCRLLPESTAAGSVPARVVTDESGLATFRIVYLKERADWIIAELRATTVVQGTEVQALQTIRLPRAESDDNLPASPYNVYFQMTDETVPASLQLDVDKRQIRADRRDSALISALVKDANNQPVPGATVDFTVSNTGADLRVINRITGGDGMAYARLYSGDLEFGDTVNLTATVEGAQGGQNLTSSETFQIIEAPKEEIQMRQIRWNEDDKVFDIEVFVSDANRTAVPNVPVTISANPASADLRVDNKLTNAAGLVTAQLYMHNLTSVTLTAVLDDRQDISRILECVVTTGTDVTTGTCTQSAATSSSMVLSSPPMANSPVLNLNASKAYSHFEWANTQPTLDGSQARTTEGQSVYIAQLTLTTDKQEIQVDGTDFAAITVTAHNQNALPVAGLPIVLEISPPVYALRLDSLETGPDGASYARLSSGLDLVGGDAHLTARIDGSEVWSNTLSVSFVGASLSADPQTLHLDARHPQTIRVSAAYADGRPAANQWLCLGLPKVLSIVSSASTLTELPECTHALITDADGTIRFTVSGSSDLTPDTVLEVYNRSQTLNLDIPAQHE
ncbi:Ig-like domain-containing protein [Thiorhodospira sibirica]|uniref:Ig-like domain-containing protein n=1 Tax=Thiorhodospira sibirica TaxID=154347 RepID=UPI00022C112F|nr:Ig-like domain-containing protein [Thiorhodospira sibirica]